MLRNSVEGAVVQELKSMPERISSRAEAATAIVLARKLDAGGDFPMAPVARELREVLGFLRALALEDQVVEAVDAVDDLNKRRAARRSGTTS